METIFTEFEAYLFQEKKMSRNSLEAYRRDIRAFGHFLTEKRIDNVIAVTESTVISYVLFLRKEGRTTSTINRKIASVRAFYNFLIKRGIIDDNPVKKIKTPKMEKKAPDYLSLEEVDKLISQPDTSPKGIRDRAILELMYATGMRVSEVVSLDEGDINLKMGFAACGSEEGKGRIIPIGTKCRESLAAYLDGIRADFVSDPKEKALFVNQAGGRLTRQGLWKMINNYAGEAGIEKRISPQILRNSFAAHMIQNGADLKSLQELLGHEDAAATQIYLTLNKSRITDVYNKTHPRA